MPCIAGARRFFDRERRFGAVVYPIGIAVGGDNFFIAVSVRRTQRRICRHTETSQYSVADRQTDILLLYVSDFYGNIPAAFFPCAIQKDRMEKSSAYRQCEYRGNVGRVRSSRKKGRTDPARKNGRETAAYIKAESAQTCGRGG